MSPICLPPKHLWRNRFHRVVVQIAGYGRIEREEEEGIKNYPTILNFFRERGFNFL